MAPVRRKYTAFLHGVDVYSMEDPQMTSPVSGHGRGYGVGLVSTLGL